ncbi:hypothetical protein [Spirillospora sp. NPDC029432]|uniref:hypothetical protein n=1 Tax=Spirillospora sp. NPDC029432 TaxID=3154599 RepID=UPI0034529D2B
MTAQTSGRLLPAGPLSFAVGAPEGPDAQMSWHGVAHMSNQIAVNGLVAVTWTTVLAVTPRQAT